MAGKKYSHLKPIFKKSLNKKLNLPNEFFEFDKTRMSYAVVAGRRIDFNDKANRLRRDEKDNSKRYILHYENLIDSTNQCIKTGDY